MSFAFVVLQVLGIVEKFGVVESKPFRVFEIL